MTTPAQRLAALRQAMNAQQYDAWIIASADPHMSEYLPEHWKGRSWLSGFTGSVGTLAITADDATLWVDSRYWVQAEHQLQGSGIRLEKLGFGKTHIDWLAERLPENAKVGIAADTLSVAAKHQLQAAFQSKNITLCHQNDLLNSFWNDRAELPVGKIFRQDDAYVDERTPSKLAKLRSAMKDCGAEYHLISALDDIAWLVDLRGSDVSFNPVFLAHLLVSHNDAVLFVDARKLTPELTAFLQQSGINTAPYEHAADAVAQVRGSLLIDPAKVAVSTLSLLDSQVRVIEQLNPTTLFKSIKSDKELESVRYAMALDGAALCGFFAEFEQKLAAGETLTELDVDTMLLAHRGKQPGFVSHSFDTIAGFNANGALPHYAATPEAYSVISGDGLLLIDSGAQYHSGTTDITRVIPIGTPTAAQKRDYTLVLKAHIALGEAVFPENIPSPYLDAICRKPLWQAQCNYGHGTGHGVGYFLNVHEGPQVIAYLAQPNPNHAMKAGMITSNEPGLYRPGQWGIRIENLVANRKVENPQETDFGSYLYFENLTLCPIDTRLVEREMLTAEEAQWLNNYHELVRSKLEPLTEGAAKEWLIRNTAAI